ncbi:MAG TPA: 50S ribosomal protein L7/L12 [Patescibacteria group bacterium]|nr:50S ribosomal protein L7/L12 [Patescibacteria group bacterium]
MANNKKIEELVEEVSKLTVLDLSELVTALQDKLGVSAMPVAAAAPVAAAPAGDAPAEQSGGNQTVVMTATGENKIAVIKTLREINQNLGLQEAKSATENLPFEVLKDAKAEDAKGAADKLKAAGATIELK